MTTKPNEREISNWIAGEFNKLFEAGGYPFEIASCETSVKVDKTHTKFPDVTIWENRLTEKAFCIIELKTPQTPVDDPVTLESILEKAKPIDAPYGISWNLSSTILWEIPQKRDKLRGFDYKKPYYDLAINSVEEFLTKTTKIKLRNRVREIVEDLASLKKFDHISGFVPNVLTFTQLLQEATNRFKEVYKVEVAKARRNSENRLAILKWAKEQGFSEATDFQEILSRQLTYKIVLRILFYFTLQKFIDLPEIKTKKIKEGEASDVLAEYFKKAKEVDYHAVFEIDQVEKIIPFPKKGKEHLIELIQKLEEYNFSQFPQDVIGDIYEKLIPPEERKNLGQYFTREDLVDFIVGFCVKDQDNKVLDPTCGSGTFLTGAYSRLRVLSGFDKKHHELLSQIWGVDVAQFPAMLSTINLFKQDFSDYSNFPRIVNKDFFEEFPGAVEKFPPPKAAIQPTTTLIEEKIPTFDAIVGNFPYIRQEEIERAIGGHKKKLVFVLGKDWLIDYPDLFEGVDKRILSFNQEGYLKNLNNLVQRSAIDLVLSGQADIYAYLFIHAAKFLKEGGRLGILTSNSWLDVAFGYELQKFFLKNFKIIAIVCSWVEPWFEDVSVNTVFTVLEKCSNKKERDDNNVKFVKLKKRLEELIPQKEIMEELSRWQIIDKLVSKIESSGSKFYKLNGTTFVNTLSKLATFEDENFRVRVVKQESLLKEVEEKKQTVKWGQYLRAPDVYFEILEKCKEKLIPLKNLAEIRRGYTTGINEFFYLDDEKIKTWGIEKEFLKPVIKSPKELKSILISSKDLKYKIFICNKSKEELRKEGKKGALKYIEWGEKQKSKSGIPWFKVPTVSGRKRWYEIQDLLTGDFLCRRFFDKTFTYPDLKRKVVVDQTLYVEEFGKVNPEIRDFLLSFLNSSVASLFTENLGRVNLGDGVLQYAVYEYDDILILDPKFVRRLNASLKKNILQLYKKVGRRKIKPILDEVKMKDRQKLDKLILKSLGLDPNDYLPKIYQGLIELVRERITLPKLRKAKKQARTKRELDKLADQVIGEVLPSGVKRFPEAFLSGIKKTDFKEVSISNNRLKLGHFFMGHREVIDDFGFKYDASSEDEARFIIYAQREEQLMVKVPKETNIIVKAVQDYGIYLRQLRERLFNRFLKGMDFKTAEVLTGLALEKLGLRILV